MENNLQVKNITIQLSTNCDLFGKKIFISKIDVMNLVLAQEKLVFSKSCFENEHLIHLYFSLLFSWTFLVIYIFKKIKCLKIT